MSMSDEDWGKLIRWITGVATSLGIFWATSGWIITPVAKAYAKDAFKQLLLADAEFAKVVKDMADAQAQVKDIHDDLDKVQRTVDRVVGQTDTVERTGAETKCLVQKLLNKELGLSTSALPC